MFYELLYFKESDKYINDFMNYVEFKPLISFFIDLISLTDAEFDKKVKS
jgi:hypothetical protein